MTKLPINWINRSDEEPPHKENIRILTATYYPVGGWEFLVAVWCKVDLLFIAYLTKYIEIEYFTHWCYLDTPADVDEEDLMNTRFSNFEERGVTLWKK